MKKIIAIISLFIVFSGCAIVKNIIHPDPPFETLKFKDITIKTDNGDYIFKNISVDPSYDFATVSFDLFNNTKYDCVNTFDIQLIGKGSIEQSKTFSVKKGETLPVFLEFNITEYNYNVSDIKVNLSGQVKQTSVEPITSDKSSNEANEKIGMKTKDTEEPEQLILGMYFGRLYSDGSGVFGTQEDIEKFKDVWDFRIQTDKITDKKIITAQRYAYNDTENFGKIKLHASISLLLVLSKAGSEYLCADGHDFPGKNATIRIDKNKPIKTDGNGCIRLTSSLDKQLRTGKEIVIRGYHWPYDGYEDNTFSLDGYAELVDFLRRKRTQK